MDIQDFKAGKKVMGFEYEFFCPEPINHSFIWQDGEISVLLESASARIGELNAYARWIPDVGMFIKMHMYKEAVVSSKIEGTQTNMEEAFLEKKEVVAEHRDDWQEVSNYVFAMNAALQEMKILPISNRLFRNTHKILLSSGRGEHKTPGEFRISQNWIGGSSLKTARFVPPAQNLVPGLMADLEKFIHNTNINVPHLIKAAIAHYQFETVHPFLDGNGRLGRLLITLYLVHSNVLDKPLLYLSDYFERNKHEYYENLMKVRQQNDLRQWIAFFLVAVRDTAIKATATLEQIVRLKKELEEEAIQRLGRRAPMAIRLYEELYSRPIMSIKEVGTFLDLTPKSAGLLVQALYNLTRLEEITGDQRSRLYKFGPYFDLFNQ